MDEKKQWFKYKPANKSRENTDVRMHIRNLSNLSGIFCNMPSLTFGNVNMDNQYDELVINKGNETFNMRVYGNGNQVVKNPRIEYYCESSKKDIANKLIDEIPL